MFLTQLVTTNIFVGRISDQCLTQLLTAITIHIYNIQGAQFRPSVFQH